LQFFCAIPRNHKLGKSKTQPQSCAFYIDNSLKRFVWHNWYKKNHANNFKIYYQNFLPDRFRLISVMLPFISTVPSASVSTGSMSGLIISPASEACVTASDTLGITECTGKLELLNVSIRHLMYTTVHVNDWMTLRLIQRLDTDKWEKTVS